MQDLHLFGYIDRQKQRSLKAGHPQVMIDLQKIRPVEQKSPGSSIGDGNKINPINDRQLLQSGIKQCQSPYFTFFKILTFPKGKLQIKRDDNVFEDVEALFLTCGHAVNEYKKDKPISQFISGCLEQHQVVFNMALFSGEVMKDPVSKALYPIPTQIAVICKFYPFPKQDSISQNVSVSTQQSIDKQNLEQEEEKSTMRSQQHGSQQIGNFTIKLESTKQIESDRLQVFHSNYGSQDSNNLQQMGTKSKGLIFVPWINNLQNGSELNLIGYVGELSQVIKDLSNPATNKKALKNFWPQAVQEIDQMPQDELDDQYAYLIQQKAMQLKERLEKLSAQLCFSVGELRNQNESFLAINISSVQGQSGSPIVLTPAKPNSEMIYFVGIHLSGPIEAGQFQDQLNQFIQVKIPPEEVRACDKKYNLALSINSQQVRDVFKGISKLVHLSEQSDEIKKIWKNLAQQKVK